MHIVEIEYAVYAIIKGLAVSNHDGTLCAFPTHS